MFTDKIDENDSPIFEEQHSYPVHVDASFKSMLRKQVVVFSVFDDRQPLSNTDSEAGIIGKAEIRLEPLAYGDSITGEFSIANDRNRETGFIRISMSWREPLDAIQPQETTSLSLSSEEMAMLMRKFDRGYQGLIAFDEFKLFALPPPVLVELETKVRPVLHGIQERGKDYKLNFSVHECDQQGLISAKDLIFAFANIGITVSGREMSLLTQYFGQETNKELIRYEELLEYLSPMGDRMSQLQARVRIGLKKALDRSADINRAFQLDRHEHGLIPRKDFKRSLSRLGFNLVEEVDETFDAPQIANEFDKSDKFGPVEEEEDRLVAEEDPIIQDKDRQAFSIRSRQIEQARKQTSIEISSQEKPMEEMSNTEISQEKSTLSREFGTKPRAADIDAVSLEDIEPKLINAFAKMRQDGIRYRESFQRFDLENVGFIQRSEFGAVLRRLGISLLVSELQVLFQKFAKPNFTISYCDFVDFVESKLAPMTPQENRDKSPRDEDRAIIPLPKIENVILGAYKQLQNTHAKSIVSMFESFDEDNDGTVPISIFKEELTKHEITLRPAQWDSIFVHFRVNDGIDYQAFEWFCKGGLSNHLQFTPHMRRQLQRLIRDDQFEQITQSSFGNISKRVYFRTVERMNLDMQSQEVEFVFEVFDIERNYSMDCNGLVEYIRDTSDAQEIAAVEKFMNLVRREQLNRTDFKSMFSSFDKEGSGSIQKSQFHRAINRLNFSLNREEINTLFNLFCNPVSIFLTPPPPIPTSNLYLFKSIYNYSTLYIYIFFQYQIMKS